MPPDQIILDYRDGKRSYLVDLAWTALNLGGKRPWFICPADGCGKRVAILYGGNTLICHHCRKLAYQSQWETKGERLRRRANRIAERLDWEPGAMFGERPRGMHRRTFFQLATEYRQLMEESIRLMSDDERRFWESVFRRLAPSKRWAERWVTQDRR